MKRIIDPIRTAKLQVQSLLAKIGLLEAKDACKDCRFCRKKIAKLGLRQVTRWCHLYKQPAVMRCIDFIRRAK